MKTAIISGSFDPITVGHLDVIERAAKLFERVVVAISANTQKEGYLSDAARLEAVKASVSDLENVEVEQCKGLLAEFCLKYENPVIVRGVRTGSDFDYERSLFIINKSLGVPETIVLPAESGMDHISSTYVRELIKYNRPLDGAVPNGAIKVIEKYLNEAQRITFETISVDKAEDIINNPDEDIENQSIIYVSINDLIDYYSEYEKYNKFTKDLEKSIKEIGFINPIIVTAFGQPEGKYLIVSGHRRKAVARILGISILPCIVKNFKDEDEIYKFVWKSNSLHSRSTDSLLLCKQYEVHEKYLKNTGFKGNFSVEIGRRIGVSKAQAERFKAMNGVISSVWDLINDDKVGFSSVVPMSKFSAKEQAEIYDMLCEAISDKVRLTRPIVKRIIDAYEAGTKSWAEIKIKE